MTGFNAAIGVWQRIEELGKDPKGKVFLEVGTGRVPIVPLAYWLMGAKRTVTVDLNPYMRPELVEDSLDYLTSHTKEIQSLFGSLIDESRLELLLDYHRGKEFSIDAFLELCSIEYIAPGNAADLDRNDQSIDFHTSFTVLEHIPAEVLKSIFKEGNRLITEQGLFVHRIDYSDHFSHSDSEISAINFLKFDETEWDRLAGNRYMYMNRLRHDDFLEIFESAGHEVLLEQPDIDERSLEILRQGDMHLDSRFSVKSEKVLSIVGSWIVSRKKQVV